MTKEKRKLPIRLLDLMSQYSSLETAGESQDLNETSVRETFLNPLLEELGWDPRNRRGVVTMDRDVILEDKLKIEGTLKAPDYAMVDRGRRLFYFEAKRPSVNVSESKSAAYQIRRYSWSAGLPLGILSDFEEIAVYDCRQMPQPSDDPSVARISYFKYKELPDKWDELYSLFSKSSVLGGSLERFVNETRLPSGAQPIDKAFLAEIRQWRAWLAEDIAEHNSAVTEVELNEVVQRTLDQLIFLRIAEARGLETVGGLKAAVESETGTFDYLSEMIVRADDRYNSGLFKPEHAGDGEERCTISDEVLNRIILRMYYPYPFEFSAMPADILGQIYEQFLGEKIELTDDRSVIVRLKPELRKSNGVYYTPQPVVDYIVAQTIGPLLKGKRPQDIESLRIVDPACGSGSFLIAAFQYLIDWHTDYYADKPRLAKENLEVSADGILRLRTAVRRRIALNNIYGVDIDRQATEVTKLSLLLKLIEGQTQMELGVGKLLPDLDRNIACGDSLIGPDFSAERGLGTNWDGVQPFSWEETWPDIFEAGGFDAVIGNPPYLNVDKVWGRGDSRTAYMRDRYSEVYADKTDLLFYFMAKAAEISKGEVSFIVSRSFLEADKAKKLRSWLSQRVRFREIIDFRRAFVFPGVGINTAIFRFSRSKAVKRTKFLKYLKQSLPTVYEVEALKESGLFTSDEVPFDALGEKAWSFGNASVNALITKIDSLGDSIGSILYVGQGMQTGNNPSFIIDLELDRFEELHRQGLVYKRARNSIVKRYKFLGEAPYVIFPNRVEKFSELPTDIQEHLESNRQRLESRKAFLRGDCDWWGYTWPRPSLERFDGARIICPYRSSTNRFALDQSQEFIGLTDTTVIYGNDQPEDLRYFLAFLNSRALTFRFRYLGKMLSGGVLEYYENTVSQLKVPRSKPGDDLHDGLVALVEERDEAVSELETALTFDDRRILELVVERIDDRIDAIVEEAFGITKEESELMKAEIDRAV